MPDRSEPLESGGGASRASALHFVVLMGVVSLCADVTYQGARGIIGPYFELLGASAAVVGTVAGFGELIGYALRLISGYATDRTRKYWTIAFVGYGVNLLAVPLMALAGRWEVVAALIILERIGKAVRVPARDAMLSHATKQIGHGWGFGLHKALDQIGAFTGPLIVALVLYLKKDGYRVGFAVLLIPALAALAMLARGRFLYPDTRAFEVKTVKLAGKGFPRAYWLYLAGAALIAAGYADFPLIAYHMSKVKMVSNAWIPISYAISMAVAAGSALAFGRLFDRIGISSVILMVVLSAFFAPLSFSGTFSFAIAGIALWGIGMGAQESVMRAVIATMVPADKRGSAYGVFNTGFGVAWFLGSAAMGGLYGLSIPALIAFSVLAQLASIPLFFLAGKSQASLKTA
jgi:MFS family permease